MSLTLTGLKPSNTQFFLQESIEIKDDIVVLTGINGSGKTRLLTSINAGETDIQIEEISVPRDKLKLVQNLKISSLGGKYDSTINEGQLNEKIKFYKENKPKILSGDISFFQSMRPRDHNAHLGQLNPLQTYLELKHLIKEFGNDLSDSEISIHLRSYNSDPFSLINISSKSNDYIRRKEKNLSHIGLNQIKGPGYRYCVTEEEFRAIQGEEPWKIFGRILKETFNGKFSITEPTPDDETFSYETKIILNNNGEEVALNALSSGEGVLIWLASTLFNLQYHKDDIVSNAFKVILFDEPDSALHPKMVQKMYSLFSVFNKEFGTKIILTTHSPTTVALAPSDSIYHVSDNKITEISKDKAIAELLDGITQVAINPENRRHVFVESHNDAKYYSELYRYLLSQQNYSVNIDPSISLNFVPSGPKLSRNHLSSMISTHLGEFSEEQLNKFLDGALGNGSCEQVISQVENLQPTANESVRGIIDWDGRDTQKDAITVLGKNNFYTIENVALDPLAILLIAHFDDSNGKVSMLDICGENVHYTKWLESPDLLQNSVNYFIQEVLGHPNNSDSELSYISGITLKSDKRYTHVRTHGTNNIEAKVLDRFKTLKRYQSSGLALNILKKSMINFSNGQFIPKALSDAIIEAQR